MHSCYVTAIMPTEFCYFTIGSLLKSSYYHAGVKKLQLKNILLTLKRLQAIYVTWAEGICLIYMHKPEDE